MTEHPELLNEECKLDIKSSFVYSQEDIKRIVEGMIQSKFDNIYSFLFLYSPYHINILFYPHYILQSSLH